MTERTTDRIPSWLRTGGDIAWRILAIVGVVVVLYLAIRKIHVIVIPVAVAVLATALFRPPALWLARRGLPRSLATAIAVFGGLALLLALTATLGWRVASQLGQLADAFADVREQLTRWLLDGPLDLTRSQVETAIDRVVSQIRQNAGTIVRGVMAGTFLILELIAGAILALVLLFFFVRDGDEMVAWALDRIGDDHRERARRLAGRGWGVLSHYIRGVAIIAAVEATGIGLGLVLIGVPLAATLAVLVFFGAFIPIIGAFVSGGFAVLVALVTKGPLAALLTFGVVLAMNQIDAHILQPVVMGHEVPLHPAAVVTVIGIGGVLYGLAGAAFAVPVAAAASAIGNELRLMRDRDGSASPA